MIYKRIFNIIGIEFITIDRETKYIPLIITEKGTSKPKDYFVNNEEELKKLKRNLDNEFCTVIFKGKFRDLVKIKIKYLGGGEELV